MRARHLPALSLAEATDAIQNDQLVIVPTMRWYMLCGAAEDYDLCRAMYRAKGRSPEKPLLLVLRGPDDADTLFEMSKDAHTLTTALWPSDLALRLRWRRPSDGRRHTFVGDPVALVGCANDHLGDLAQRSGRLLAATSANVSDTTNPANPGPAVSPQEVIAFAAQARPETPIAGFIDHGVCPQFQHMTIVDCSSGPATIERTGTTHERVIAHVLARQHLRAQPP